MSIFFSVVGILSYCFSFWLQSGWSHCGVFFGRGSWCHFRLNVNWSQQRWATREETMQILQWSWFVFICFFWHPWEENFIVVLGFSVFSLSNLFFSVQTIFFFDSWIHTLYDLSLHCIFLFDLLLALVVFFDRSSDFLFCLLVYGHRILGMC